MQPRANCWRSDDAWIPSTCALCYGTCSILAHRVDGVVVKIEGNPGQRRRQGPAVRQGRQRDHDPLRSQPADQCRCGAPTRRRASTRIRAGRRSAGTRRSTKSPTVLEARARRRSAQAGRPAHDHRHGEPRAVPRLRRPRSARRTIRPSGGGLHCGNGAHLISGIMHASWSIVPDFEYCNYAIYFGASKGHGPATPPARTWAMAADARARGMKMVVVDPMCNFAAAKATEWVPLRVGTDAALALAMCNVLVNELGDLRRPLPAGQDQRALPDRPGQALRARSRRRKQAAGLGQRERTPRVPSPTSRPPTWRWRASSRSTASRCQPAFHCCKRASAGSSRPEWGERHHRRSPAANIRRLAKEFGTRSAHRQHHRGRRRDAALSAGGGDRVPRLAGPHELGLQFLRRRSAQSSGRRRRRGRLLPRLQSGLPRPSRNRQAALRPERRTRTA